jgi:predicted aspartyl protease
MFSITVVVTSRRKQWELPVLVDTGFDGALWLPQSAAEDMKLTLVDPERPVSTVTGESVPGKASVAPMTVKDSGRRSVQMPVYVVADAVGSRAMVGAFFLARMGATLAVGDVEATLPRRNPLGFDIMDWSGVRAPWSVSFKYVDR